MDSLESVREEYQRSVEELHAAADAIEEFDPEATPEDGEEAVSFEDLQATFDGCEQNATELRDKLTLLERTQEARSVSVPDSPSGSARVTTEPLTYTRENGNSIFRDMYRAEKHNDRTAIDRLERHQAEMRERSEFDLSSTDSAGGYLVAPLFLQEEFVTLARAGRPTANAIGSRALPPNTDSLNIPTMDGGTAVATQADGGAVQKTDATFNTLAVDVKTVAGMQDVSQQLVDRSVPGVDEVIFADLAKALAVNLDVSVLSSTTTNNKGILQVSGINTVTYTDSTPTLPELYPKIANAIQQIHTGIFTPPTAIFMHPRRWGFCLASSDGNSRPLIVPAAQQPLDVAGTQQGVVSQGPVGTIQGLPVITDSNIPTTNGAGTNEDQIIVAAVPELYLWEETAGPFLETFRDVGSGTLTVRFRLHNYWGQLHARRPKAISVISGTGLSTPSF